MPARKPAAVSPVTFVLDCATRQAIHRSAVDMAIKDRRTNLSYKLEGSLQAEARFRTNAAVGAGWQTAREQERKIASDLWIASYRAAAAAIADLGAEPGEYRAAG